MGVSMVNLPKLHRSGRATLSSAWALALWNLAIYTAAKSEMIARAVYRDSERRHRRCAAIGSNATILPVRIADNVVIGAGSVVTSDITASGTYAGNPARRLASRK